MVDISIQGNAAANVGGHIEVFALVDGGLALVEASFGDNLEWQLGLAEFRLCFSDAAGTAGLLLQQLGHFFGRQRWRRRHEARMPARAAGRVEKLYPEIFPLPARSRFG